jgi:hypothetical protein
MEEANYEFERNANADGGSPANLRHQEYWTMLSGATGQLYASRSLPTGWLSSWRSRLDMPRGYAAEQNGESVRAGTTSFPTKPTRW